MAQCIDTKFKTKYGETEEDVMPQKDLECILDLLRDEPYKNPE